MMRYNLFLLSLLFILASCAERRTDATLKQVSDLIALNPSEALDSLHVVDYGNLSDADRHFYDFLTIKAKDKAYIKHTDDSLILDVIGYYSKVDKGLYAEALYYGGRVYSDLGDFPTALEYFHDALEQIGLDSRIGLRGNVTSQTGRLLIALRLYEEAIPYIREAILVDSVERDTFNLAYDYELLGISHMYSAKPDSARKYLYKSIKLASHISKEDESNMSSRLLELELRLGNIEEAKRIIRLNIDSVSTEFRNLMLANASTAYLKAGILDTAYMYSREILNSADENNHRIGLRNILSTDLRSLVPKDSLDEYFSMYFDDIEEFYNGNKSQLAVLRQSQYNYSVHERERMKAEAKNAKMERTIYVLTLIILSLFILSILYKLRNKRTLLELNNAKQKIAVLQQMIDSPSSYCVPSFPHGESDSENIVRLRDSLREDIKRIEKLGENKDIPDDILTSSTYQSIRRFIDADKVIADQDGIWNSLFDLIKQGNPQFWDKINVLMGGNVKFQDRQTIALIKCGLSPTQMACVLGKSKSAISSRRVALSSKIFGEKTDQKVLDSAIRLL